MSMKDILSEILKRIKTAEKELSEAIASGINVHNFDTYQRLVGKREGLSDTLSIIDSILSEDDEDL
jgi:aromatic ring-opening dioxygenase catalytic subunit (LigB family)